VLDPGRVDVDEIAAALAGQTDYEHRWLINPQTGEVCRDPGVSSVGWVL
jgi:hypothetical protein